MIQETSIVVTAKEKRYSKLDQEVVILDLKSEEYYGLNHVGATIWKSLQEPSLVGDLRDEVVAKYDGIDSQQCYDDLKSFLEGLEAEGLIEIRNEVAA